MIRASKCSIVFSEEKTPDENSGSWKESRAVLSVLKRPFCFHCSTERSSGLLTIVQTCFTWTITDVSQAKPYCNNQVVSSIYSYQWGRQRDMRCRSIRLWNDWAGRVTDSKDGGRQCWHYGLNSIQNSSTLSSQLFLLVNNSHITWSIFTEKHLLEWKQLQAGTPSPQTHIPLPISLSPLSSLILSPLSPSISPSLSLPLASSL